METKYSYGSLKIFSHLKRRETDIFKEPSGYFSEKSNDFLNKESRETEISKIDFELSFEN